MSDTKEKEDLERGDEVLRRLLKSPPDHKIGKGEKPKSKGEKQNANDDC